MGWKRGVQLTIFAVHTKEKKRRVLSSFLVPLDLVGAAVGDGGVWLIWGGEQLSKGKTGEPNTARLSASADGLNAVL